MVRPSSSPAELSLLALTPDELQPLWSELAPRALLAVCHGCAPPMGAEGLPVVEPPNRLLAGPPLIELWVAPTEVQRGTRGGVAWSADARVLFGAVRRPLLGDLAEESELAFRDLLDLLEAEGYPNLLRVWNLLPRINAEQAGVERYRLFNLGRARAFEGRFGREAAELRYPASTAVGTSGDELIVWFAASRVAGTHLENPRQERAYRYPPEFGTKPPSFSRGTLTPKELGEMLLLSGTASIVGCESRHLGCVSCQLGETLANIESVVTAATSCARGSEVRCGDFGFLRVYVRHPENLPEIQRGLASHLDPTARILFLEADICRAELLLEIEGVALAAPAA